MFLLTLACGRQILLHRYPHIFFIVFLFFYFFCEAKLIHHVMLWMVVTSLTMVEHFRQQDLLVRTQDIRVPADATLVPETCALCNRCHQQETNSLDGGSRPVTTVVRNGLVDLELAR
jgi:hypothetical protein